MEIYIKKLSEGAQTPYRASASAAGYDLYAALGGGGKKGIEPGGTCMIGTGIALAIPEGCFGAIYPRSGLATKFGLRPANCVGVIDSDYRGEIIVALRNDSTEPRYIQDGDRIAQLIIERFEDVSFVCADSLGNTERGEGGFGHTGIGNKRNT